MALSAHGTPPSELERRLVRGVGFDWSRIRHAGGTAASDAAADDQFHEQHDGPGQQRDHRFACQSEERGDAGTSSGATGRRARRGAGPREKTGRSCDGRNAGTPRAGPAPSGHSYRALRLRGFKETDEEFAALVATHSDLFRETRIIRRDEEGRRVIPGWPGVALRISRTQPAKPGLALERPESER